MLKSGWARCAAPLCGLFFLLLLPACNLRSAQATPTAPVLTDTPPATIPPTRTRSASNTPVPIQLTSRDTPDPNAVIIPTLPPLNRTIAPIGLREPDLPTITPPIPFPQTFPNNKPVNASAGQTIIIEYDIVITDSSISRVFLVVRDPNGADVARLVFTESSKANLQVPATLSGVYEVLDAVENLRGYYSINIRLE